MDSFLELSEGHIWLRIFLSLLVVVGFAFAARTVYWLIRYVAWGKGDLKVTEIPMRIRGVMTQVIGQARVIAEPAGVLHLFIFWGFIILQVESIEYIIRGFFWDFHFSTYVGRSVYNAMVFSQDIFGLLVLIAVTLAAVRRYIIRPKHSLVSLDAAIILGLIALLMLSKFVAHGAELAFVTTPGHDPQWTPVALAFAGFFQSLGASPQSEGMFWIHHVAYWVHIAIIVAFANYIPFGKHLHLIGAIPNIFFRKLEPNGALYPIDMEDENIESFGVSKVEDLTWKQLLDTYACTECGRCEHYCPAYNTGKPLNPMMIIHNIKEHLREKGTAVIRNGQIESAEEFPLLTGGVISKEELWACTTCGACVANCPVHIEHVDTIVDMRRHLALMEADFPVEVGRTFRNMENNSNPWGISSSYRGDWAEGLDIPMMSELTEPPEYLFFVGCAGSFDDRQKKVTQAFARILKNAGVRFAILGPEEACTGDPARRIGNEYLYYTLATQNIETLNSYNVTKIVTTCPHCFHTVGKEYPQLGGNYEVIHHTAILNDLIKTGRIHVKPSAPIKITYHDSCYIGRWDDSYDNPREVLESVPGVQVQEMDLNKKQSFCCGAGGGRMWMEETQGKRVNIERTDQALATKPDAIAVNCPFCLTMFDDGLKNRGAESVALLDLAEIIADNLVEKSSEDEATPILPAAAE